MISLQERSRLFTQARNRFLEHPIAWVTTLIYLIIAFVILPRVFPADKDFTLNELGDFLAGTFAPLAFLWLVVGYFQQSKEIEQNTEALKLQRDEMRDSVGEAQRQNELLEQSQLISDRSVFLTIAHEIQEEMDEYIKMLARSIFPANQRRQIIDDYHSGRKGEVINDLIKLSHSDYKANLGGGSKIENFNYAKNSFCSLFERLCQLAATVDDSEANLTSFYKDFSHIGKLYSAYKNIPDVQ